VEEAVPDGAVLFHLNHNAGAASVNMAVGVCTDSPMYSARRAYDYLGDGADLTELRQLV
jgi:hypothetical protein